MTCVHVMLTNRWERGCGNWFICTGWNSQVLRDPTLELPYGTSNVLIFTDQTFIFVNDPRAQGFWNSLLVFEEGAYWEVISKSYFKVEVWESFEVKVGYLCFNLFRYISIVWKREVYYLFRYCCDVIWRVDFW